MIQFIIGAFLALLALFGIQTLRVKNKDKKIQTLEKEVVKEKKQTVIYETVVTKHEDIKSEVEAITKEYDKLEEQLEQAKTNDDIISIANDIVDKFNRVQNN